MEEGVTAGDGRACEKWLNDAVLDGVVADGGMAARMYDASVH